MSIHDPCAPDSEQSRDEFETLPLDAARTRFAWLTGGPRPLSIDGRLFPGLPDREIALDEVRDLLLDRRATEQMRDDVWTHLVLRSRTEGRDWTIACVGVALPSLATTAAWMAARYRGDRADVHSAVLTGFLAALASVDLSDPRILTRLRLAARRAGLAALQESLTAPAPLGSDFHSQVPPPPYGHQDLVLADAVADGVLTATEADLISATRVGDTPVAQWARTHHRALRTAYKIRTRAEIRLTEWLWDRVAEPDETSPNTDSAPDRTPPHPHRTTSPHHSRSPQKKGPVRREIPKESEKTVPSVSKKRRKTGLLGCGEPLPRSSRDTDSESNPEASSCA